MTARPSRPVAALLGLLALPLAGCPLPQALPEYPDSQQVAPPRIRSDLVSPLTTLTEVGPDCATPPGFTLSASLVDDNATEPVEARWFVDYLPGDLFRERDVSRETIPGPADGVTRTRDVTPYLFEPYKASSQAQRDAGAVHVVELVLSNGFAADPGPPERPYRSPQPNFETQVYRWVFHYVPGGSCDHP